MALTYQIDPMDNWFFRDSKPMNAGESGWLESTFPPTGQTLQGAIRTAILDKKNINYKEFNEASEDKKTSDIQQRIGNATSLGEMQLNGPWIRSGDDLNYPLPLDLVHNSRTETYGLLNPSETPVDCDLGIVRMPAISNSGFKTIDDACVDIKGMSKLLNGDHSAISEHITYFYKSTKNKEALADKEPKVGLARDNNERRALEGMLFAIAPIRPRKGVSLILGIDGLEQDDLSEEFLQPVGGEGKLAYLKKTDEIHHPPLVKLQKVDSVIRFKMVFTTHALMSQEGWLPKDFKETEQDGCKFWQGEIDKVPVKIITACIGKPYKIGGWNHAEKMAKPLVNYVPAGSVYFCETALENEDNLIKLHNTKIGDQTAYGFGHVLLGQW